MTLLVLIMISTLYSGIANEIINSLVFMLKYIVIPAVLLSGFFLLSKKINLRVVFFFCILIIYVLATNNINNTFMIFILQLYSIFIIAYWVSKYKQYDLYEILKSVYLISFTLLIFGFTFLILDISLLKFIPASGLVRYAGFYGSPIMWGFVNATLSIIGIYLYSVSKNKAYLITILITLLFMLLSGTRGSFLLIVVFIFCYYILDRKFVIWLLVVPIIGLIILNMSSLLSLLTRDGAGDITSGRITIWLSVLELFDYGYFTGLGFKGGGTELISMGYVGPGYREGRESVSLHNSYLNILFGNGMIIILIIVGYLLTTVYKVKKINKFIFSYFCAFLVVSFFEDILLIPFFYSTWIFYFLMFYNHISTFYTKLNIKKINRKG
jgi:hypothetical protein